MRPGALLELSLSLSTKKVVRGRPQICQEKQRPKLAFSFFSGIHVYPHRQVSNDHPPPTPQTMGLCRGWGPGSASRLGTLLALFHRGEVSSRRGEGLLPAKAFTSALPYTIPESKVPSAESSEGVCMNFPHQDGSFLEGVCREGG